VPLQGEDVPPVDEGAFLPRDDPHQIALEMLADAAVEAHLLQDDSDGNIAPVGDFGAQHPAHDLDPEPPQFFDVNNSVNDQLDASSTTIVETSGALLKSTMVTVATKWMGLSDLDGLNKQQVEQLAGASKQNKETTNKTSGKAKQMK